MKPIAALRVRQWLPEWDSIAWNEDLNQRKPLEHFYVFSMSAKRLRELSGVYRRDADPKVPRTINSGPQRFHDEARSREIGEFVRYGFPWSDLNTAKRSSEDFESLKKPGWLPTSVVVNILNLDDDRNGSKVHPDCVITIRDDADISYLSFPDSDCGEGIPPIEVIDGQHRLWAFSDEQVDDSFELPVVAFHGLDRSWQAYLFWTINIKPKKINASLAYDLYPLLRGEDWLERFYGHSIYRETRAQELVESLWSHPASPWNGKINMLGEKGADKGTITQAAWVRTLVSTFLRPWTLEENRLGGFFGAPKGSNRLTLEWGRPLQAALLILIWQELETAITPISPSNSPLFDRDHGLLSSDQGVRAVLYTFNDFLVASSTQLKLDRIDEVPYTEPLDTSAVDKSLEALKQLEPLTDLVGDISAALATFDWRPFNAIDPGESEMRSLKAGFRGSGGYKLLRETILHHLTGKLQPTHQLLCNTVGRSIGVLG